jgi:hypothetical protein
LHQQWRLTNKLDLTIIKMSLQLIGIVVHKAFLYIAVWAGRVIVLLLPTARKYFVHLPDVLVKTAAGRTKSDLCNGDSAKDWAQLQVWRESKWWNGMPMEF